jgi:hypothetical protein
MSSDLTELGQEARLGLASSCSYAARRPPWQPESPAPLVLAAPALRCGLVDALHLLLDAAL